MVKKLTPIIGIACITLLELYALSKGINGVALAGTLVLIAGVAGYSAPHPKSKRW